MTPVVANTCAIHISRVTAQGLGMSGQLTAELQGCQGTMNRVSKGYSTAGRFSVLEVQTCAMFVELQKGGMGCL